MCWKYKQNDKGNPSSQVSSLVRCKLACLLWAYHISWHLHISNKQLSCLHARLSITPPHTEHRLVGPRFALIDSLIVLSENSSVHFEVTRRVGNLPLPHRILRIGDGRDFFFFFRGSPPPYCRFSTHHGGRMRASTSFYHPPENTHRTRFTKVTKACHFYRALLGLYKKETIHCKIWSAVYRIYWIHWREVNMTSSANKGIMKASSIYKYFQVAGAITRNSIKWYQYGRSIWEVTNSF